MYRGQAAVVVLGLDTANSEGAGQDRETSGSRVLRLPNRPNPHEFGYRPR